ncbi:DsbA family protein [Oceanicoccus sp. KOV_DT_Chl]|uniref:DsbA family oxidoreductase n=1 Tax=Oceanicoccus sp. KOV_DT_Chl TaxID=1904639 RepID=UPI000C7AF516|nr:DsbA family protein [Oceanicoccus sp. KOV_DT_Chl]
MLVIDYFSDVLCIWAWIAQRRIDELNKQFKDQINIRHHYMDIFGDVNQKITTQWQQRNTYTGFAEHVLTSAQGFETAPVNPEIWNTVRPTTSASAHLFIQAVSIAHSELEAIAYARSLREAFFINAIDISQQDELVKLLEQQNLDSNAILSIIRNGQAIAALMSDYQRAKQLNLRGSPSYVMNNERQILFGNVGYRVLSANIEEILKHVSHEASWC